MTVLAHASPRLLLARTLLVCLAGGLCVPGGPVLAQEAARLSPPLSPPVSPGANPLSTIDPASLTGFRDRPLFSPTRRRPPAPEREPVPAPETEPEAAPAAEPDPPLNIRLLGIVGTPEGLTALVLDLDDETRHSLGPGETFHGWTVATLDGTEMVMTRGGESQDFPVFTPTDNAPEDATAPPAEDATP
ncbi:hypothetical protein [Rhizobium rhizosphaerae]|uniref:hypothetical protein n=1 Tax=Xaviernesmea rhizosphaerae TaxID=1672749 RepID=UPI0011182614|nr:hypothetical protein [Xaviernesmea rhizosphaerae]